MYGIGGEGNEFGPEAQSLGLRPRVWAWGPEFGPEAQSLGLGPKVGCTESGERGTSLDL